MKSIVMSTAWQCGRRGLDTVRADAEISERGVLPGIDTLMADLGCCFPRLRGLPCWGLGCACGGRWVLLYGSRRLGLTGQINRAGCGVQVLLF